MSKIVLPKKIEIQLLHERMSDIKKKTVLVGLHIFAKSKNDFYLGPFHSNSDGKIIIYQKDLLASLKTTYSTGLMDYSDIHDSYPLIELTVYTKNDTKNIIKTRSKVWTNLLEGETESWDSINDLLLALKSSLNLRYNIIAKPIRDEWLGKKQSYKYDLPINF